jgi:hypothetical protein
VGPTGGAINKNYSFDPEFSSLTVPCGCLPPLANEV